MNSTIGRTDSQCLLLGVMELTGKLLQRCTIGRGSAVSLCSLKKAVHPSIQIVDVVKACNDQRVAVLSEIRIDDVPCFLTNRCLEDLLALQGSYVSV